MNTKQTTIIFVGLALAGLVIALSGQVLANDFAQTLMIAIGSAIFGSGLTFFLIRSSK